MVGIQRWASRRDLYGGSVISIKTMELVDIRSSALSRQARRPGGQGRKGGGPVRATAWDRRTEDEDGGSGKGAVTDRGRRHAPRGQRERAAAATLFLCPPGRRTSAGSAGPRHGMPGIRRPSSFSIGLSPPRLQLLIANPHRPAVSLSPRVPADLYPNLGRQSTGRPDRRPASVGLPARRTADDAGQLPLSQVDASLRNSYAVLMLSLARGSEMELVIRLTGRGIGR